MPILRDCAIWYGGNDLTATADEVSFDSSFATVNVTTFGSSGNVTNVAGLEDAQMSVMTFLDTTLTDAVFSTNRGGVSDLLTAVAFPTGGTVTAGDTCYAIRAQLKNDPIMLKVGDAARINANFAASQVEGLLQGMVLAPSAAVTASGDGSAVQLGAQSSGQIAYFGVHVFSVSGNRTITPVLQSAAASNFSSSTDRVTLSSINSAGSSFGSSSTATTDTYWRASYTIGGSSGSITFAAFAAIA